MRPLYGSAVIKAAHGRTRIRRAPLPRSAAAAISRRVRRLSSTDMTKIPLRRFTAPRPAIDEQGRVLLLHGFDPARPDEPFWFTIGGAAEDGETLQEAAVRELHEEVGIRAGGRPAHRTVRHQHDRVLLHRVRRHPGPDVLRDPGGPRTGQSRTSTWKRWRRPPRWVTGGGAPRRLEATDEVVFPEDLAGIVRKINSAA